MAAREPTPTSAKTTSTPATVPATPSIVTPDTKVQLPLAAVLSALLAAATFYLHTRIGEVQSRADELARSREHMCVSLVALRNSVETVTRVLIADPALGIAPTAITVPDVNCEQGLDP